MTLIERTDPRWSRSGVVARNKLRMSPLNALRV